ncbi:hypothetical protein V6N13_130075 [Hibiscus sabdariffa]|uniref:Uncharacterized protein n=1 Tax=Hibiscus sabdariffa TaxID=183260 RepID=A0ABR2SN24_9ROSI
MGSLDFILGNTIDGSSEDVPKVLTYLDKANDYISKVDNPNNESTVQHLAEMMTKICTMVSGEPVLESPTMDVISKEFHFSILFAIGVGDIMLQQELLQNALMDNNLQWLCHCYSTRVYRDCKGIYVDADYPTNPTNEMVKLRLAAEQGWLNLVFDVGFKAHVFRFGDICQALEDNIYTQLSKRNYHIKDDDPKSWKIVFVYALDLVEKKWHCPAKKITWHESVE